jgi:transcriptional regulator GlxA family with amidase domain
MRTAFVIFNGLTAMDFIGIYDPLRRLKNMGLMPDFQWDICALSPEVEDENGLVMIPTKVGASLSSYDILIVAGGLATRKLVNNTEFINWIKTAEPCPLKVSVCSGALLLGAAGFLKGKKATTHRSAFDLLQPYCQEVVDSRIVDEDDVITARGVTSGIDLGLYLCEKLVNTGAKQQIQQIMDYPYF